MTFESIIIKVKQTALIIYSTGILKYEARFTRYKYSHVHQLKNSQVVAVRLYFVLKLVEKQSQLHTDDKRCHGQEHIAPHQHVNVMNHVNYQLTQLKNQFRHVYIASWQKKKKSKYFP